KAEIVHAGEDAEALARVVEVAAEEDGVAVVRAREVRVAVAEVNHVAAVDAEGAAPGGAVDLGALEAELAVELRRADRRREAAAALERGLGDVQLAAGAELEDREVDDVD